MCRAARFEGSSATYGYEWAESAQRPITPPRLKTTARYLCSPNAMILAPAATPMYSWPSNWYTIGDAFHV